MDQDHQLPIEDLTSTTHPTHVPQSGGKALRQPVPEDVDGALRFTPLTSCVPASGVLNVLPPPHFACLDSANSLNLTSEQERQLNDYFNVLNRVPQNPAEDAFQREQFKQTIDLLSQGNDRHFRFKTPPGFPGHTPTISQNVYAQATADLGMFSRTVLEQTITNFRYPTPITPETQLMLSDHTLLQPPQSAPFSIPIPMYDANLRPYSATSLPPHGSPKRQTFAVEIISRPMQPTPTSSVTSSTPKRQKPSYDHIRHGSASPTPTRTIMEKDRVDAMINQFTTLLEDIFEAEDAFNPDAEEPTEGSIAFFSHNSLREENPWLSKEMHRKLDFHLRKLAKTTTAREGLRVDTSDLSRITGICERAVKAAEMVDLKDIDDEEDADREWVVGKLGKIENAILAANVIMLLIAGRGTDQQIYSEETLKSIVEVLRIFLDCLFQWVAAGSSDSNISDTLSIAVSCSRQISVLLQNCVNLLSQFESQLAETVSQESIINVLQFLAVEAIFLENQAKDKETIISNQGIESLRVISMGILRQVFASYPDQRSFILDEVLTSLAKLPATRQQARHFKLLDGKAIQLVSALMMKLVQACGACFNIRNVDSPIMEAQNDDIETEVVQRDNRINLFADEWARAAKAANQSASYIVSYLTSRALQTSRAAPTDSPFKALLDIFTEDFLTVLTAPEWPAAELLLRSLIKNLYVCIDGDNHGAQVKNVALDAVGQIAAKIRAVRKKLRTQLSSRSDEDTATFTLIARAADYTTGPSLTMNELIDLQEIHRIMWAKSDSGVRDALRFQVCSWANFVLSTDRLEDEEVSTRRSTPLIEELARIARAGTAQFDSLSLPSDLDISLACTMLLARSPLFQSWDSMLSRILRSMSEKQPTFRTKALRALGQIIVADPDILSLTNVQQQVALRISDPSPAVREAAIELVSKHIASDPVLGKKYYEVIRGRVNDAGLGVRKRVIKLLKDIYFKCDDKSMQAEISASILSRIADEEHSELAVKTMEELWFMPAGEEIDMNGTFDFLRLNVKAQKTIRIRTMAMAQVLGENDERMIVLFRRLLRTMCAETSKAGRSIQSRLDACKLSVHCLYDIALNGASEGKMANFKRCLLVISLFAKSTPSVFSTEHITTLEPYLKGSSDKDDQEISYFVVLIYRTLLDQAQLTFQPEFLARAMTTIATSMTSVSLKHLKESVPAVCLIAGLLNDYSNIIKVVQTCFRPVKASERMIDSGELNTGNTTLIRCLYLLGLFAQHAKIDTRGELFTAALGLPRNISVTGLIAKSLAAFSKPVVPESLRKIAITSYGFLCLGNPDFFKSETGEAQQIIATSLRNGSQTLKRTILEIFQDYFTNEELKAEIREGIKKEDVDVTSDIGVLTGTATSVNTDEASFFLAGNFLGDIMDCSLSDSTPLAVTATEVFDSIVRGGLAAPSDAFPTLVALETSPIVRVRQIGSRCRVWASTRYEDVIETTYRSSMEKQDSITTELIEGYYLSNGEPVSLIASLYSDVKAKKRLRGKFLRGLVNFLDRDSQSKEHTAPIEIDFARFVVENLLYLDYGVIEEVFTVIHTIDRIISSTGISLLQSIENKDTSEAVNNLARRSIVFSLMVGLKQHLKAAYNLTEAKCRAFDPKKTTNAKDNKPAVRGQVLETVEWPDIPYLEKKFEDDYQMHEQLDAFVAIIRRDEVAGSQEIMPTSEDELQTASVKDDDSVINEDELVASQTLGTPLKVKKRKEGSEIDSAKKKQKMVIQNV